MSESATFLLLCYVLPAVLTAGWCISWLVQALRQAIACRRKGKFFIPPTFGDLLFGVFITICPLVNWFPTFGLAIPSLFNWTRASLRGLLDIPLVPPAKK